MYNSFIKKMALFFIALFRLPLKNSPVRFNKIITGLQAVGAIHEDLSLNSIFIGFFWDVSNAWGGALGAWASSGLQRLGAGPKWTSAMIWGTIEMLTRPCFIYSGVSLQLAIKHIFIIFTLFLYSKLLTS